MFDLVQSFDEEFDWNGRCFAVRQHVSDGAMFTAHITKGRGRDFDIRQYGVPVLFNIAVCFPRIVLDGDG